MTDRQSANGVGEALRLVEEERYEEAEQRLRQGIVTLDAAVGPESAEVGAAVRELAAVVAVAGRSDEAIVLYERALAIVRQSPHPDLEVVTTLHNLALLHEKAGRAARAAAIWAEAAAVAERFAVPEPAVQGHPAPGREVEFPDGHSGF